jgi:putative hemolysin
VSGLVVELLLVAVLVAVNAALSGSELALLSLRDGQVRRLEATHKWGPTLAGLVRDPNRFLATIQIGITLAGFLASATAAVSIAEVLAVPLEGVLGEAAQPVAVILITIVLSYLTLVLGELAPKRLAMQNAERWSLVAARPLEGIAWITKPAVWLLSASTDLVVRVFGSDPQRPRDEAADEELRSMVASSTRLGDHQQRIIAAAFEIADRPLRAVVRPRRSVVSVDASLPCREAAATLIAAGHSRAPVVHGDLDHIVGVVSLAQLVSGPGDELAAAHARPVRHLPETVAVLDALHVLQSAHQQLAIVVDEYGGTEGIVTIEDLLEELVGELYDDADPDLAAVRHEADGALVVRGSFPVHDLIDLIDLDVALAPATGDRPYTTVAGLVLAELGHIPEAAGESVTIDGWDLSVTEVNGRAITEVRLARRPSS